jgi:type IV pilus assembly protein PilM
MKNTVFFSPSLGLTLSPQGLKGAKLSYFQGKVKIQALFLVHSDPARSTKEHVKMLYMEGHEEDFGTLVNECLSITCLNSKVIITRPLHLTLTKEKDINQVLSFETEPLLPFPVEEAVLDKAVISKGTDGTNLIVFAAKKEDILTHIEHYHEINVDPEVVSAPSYAFAAFSKYFTKADTPHFMLHVGWNEMTLLIVDKGMVIASQSATLGIWSILEVWADKNNLNPFEQIEAFYSLEQNDLSALTEPLLKEMKRLLLFLSKQQTTPIDSILFCGEGVKVKGLKEAFFELSQKQELPAAEEEPNQTQILAYALAIGLGLTGLPNKQDQINFRQSELAHPHPFKRLIKPLSILAAASLILTGSIVFYTYSAVQKQKVQAKQEYLSLLSALGLNQHENEESFKKDNPTETILTVENMTPDDLYRRLNDIESKLKKEPDLFPLTPNIPQVSDVLTWLANTKLIKGEESKLKLESFEYKLIKYPTQSKPKEKYQARVDLEFSATSPRYAREFQEFLLAPNELIDPKIEVKWNADRERYRASFVLKDKTVYPRD